MRRLALLVPLHAGLLLGPVDDRGGRAAPDAHGRRLLPHQLPGRPRDGQRARYGLLPAGHGGRRVLPADDHGEVAVTAVSRGSLWRTTLRAEGGGAAAG